MGGGFHLGIPVLTAPDRGRTPSSRITDLPSTHAQRPFILPTGDPEDRKERVRGSGSISRGDRGLRRRSTTFLFLGQRPLHRRVEQAEAVFRHQVVGARAVLVL